MAVSQFSTRSINNFSVYRNMLIPASGGGGAAVGGFFTVIETPVNMTGPGNTLFESENGKLTYSFQGYDNSGALSSYGLTGSSYYIGAIKIDASGSPVWGRLIQPLDSFSYYTNEFNQGMRSSDSSIMFCSYSVYGTSWDYRAQFAAINGATGSTLSFFDSYDNNQGINTFGHSAVGHTDGNVYVSGFSTYGNQRQFIMQMNSGLTGFNSTAMYEPQSGGYGDKAFVTQMGSNFVTIGKCSNPNVGANSYLISIRKFSNVNSYSWDYAYYDSASYNSAIYSYAGDRSSDIVYVHARMSNDNSSSLMKIDTNGTMVWRRDIPFTSNYNNSSMDVDSAGNIYVATQNVIFKFNSSGDLLWQRTIDVEGNWPRISVTGTYLEYSKSNTRSLVILSLPKDGNWADQTYVSSTGKATRIKTSNFSVTSPAVYSRLSMSRASSSNSLSSITTSKNESSISITSTKNGI
jgi:hypothetical protein